MLKRIVIAGEEALANQLRQAAAGHPVEIVIWNPDAPPPTATCAVAGDQPEPLLAAAETLGKRAEAVLALLADAVDVREALPLGSSRRVHAHCARFGAALELAPADALAFERAAYVRDIGKLRIHNDILLKKSVLTYDEWIILQRHTALGADLLQELDLFTDCVDIVKHHHECWDGTGYPERKEREEIPLLARAMRIVDVYCAMTSPRSYRKNYSSHEQAVEHLKSERGKHFDPALLDAFLSDGVAQPLEAG
ncbi:MAG: HD-GYP domain-containing protein [Candidatus Hydrogenedentota bacterium]